ncbi:MAG TPA: hypothetical protein VF173_17725 [Thermoanaerobaculia bacterium]|nr:hypothetical protein [Thermoanaerobaculia bacterium]
MEAYKAAGKIPESPEEGEKTRECAARNRVYRARVAALVESIEADAALRRRQSNRSVIGVEAILAMDSQHRPAELARSPAPLLHTFSKAARVAFYEAYSWFVSAFRKAAEALKAGDRSAPFPAGSFPPALPFVAG